MSALRWFTLTPVAFQALSASWAVALDSPREPTQNHGANQKQAVGSPPQVRSEYVHPPTASRASARTFTPHVSGEAQTIGSGRIAFQRCPGANMNTSLFLGCLTVGAGSELEFGTQPLLWLAPQHNYNGAFKWNFSHAEEVDSAFGITLSDWKLSDRESLALGTAQVLVNSRPRSSLYWWGGMIGASRAFHSVSGERSVMLGEALLEYSVDVSRAIGMTDLTLGVGKLRDFGFSSFEETFYGAGLTLAWYRPGRFLSKPALGFHYAPKPGHFQMLFNTSFN